MSNEPSNQQPAAEPPGDDGLACAAVKKHRLYVLAAVLAAAVVAITAIVLCCGPRLYCSATEPRPSAVRQWQRITTSPPPAKLDPNFFNKFTITSLDDRYVVHGPTANPVENAFPFELRHWKLGRPLEIAGGTLECVTIGVAYLDANQTAEDETRYRFYDANLSPIPAELVKRLHNFRLSEPVKRFVGNPFPHIQLGFRLQPGETVKFLGPPRAFDATTSKQIAKGWECSGGKGLTWYRMPVALWHRAPVDVVINVLSGPVRTFEFEPQPGTGFEQEGFSCRLLAVVPDVKQGSWLGNGFFKAPPGQGATGFVFVCQPRAESMRVTFDFLDAQGNVLFGRGSSTGGFLHMVSLDQPLEKVALIRASYGIKRYRLILHIPYIPHLPRENDSIENLFDVRVPYARFTNADEVRDFLVRALQLSAAGETGRRPPANIHTDVFPMEFADVTVRDIARRYGRGGTLRLDAEKEQLIVEYPGSFLEKLKRILRRILP